MVNGINLQQLQGSQSTVKMPDPGQMFSNLAEKVGADENGITKEDLQNYQKKLEENGQGDGRESKFISKMIEDFDQISGGSDSITAESMQQAFKSKGPQPPKDSGQMFSDLAKKVGADDSGITKENLENYLEELQENGNGDGKEAEQISNLIKNFDTISGGSDAITAESMQNAFETQKPPPPNDFQDPSTITSEQLQSPIDIRI